MYKSEIIREGESWFKKNGWTPLPFQKETWELYDKGYSGLVNAPTGSGKTFSLLIPAILKNRNIKNPKGIRIIWVTPIRALAKEILISAERAISGFDLDWTAEIRTGDTSTKQRKSQWDNPPDILITTPESIHVLMTQKAYPVLFKGLTTVVVDEWHELVGSKRGVLMELALSRLSHINPGLQIWGISATIGNLEEATDILLGVDKGDKWKIVKSNSKKKIKITTAIPKEIDKFPWAGHLGLKMIDQVLEIIEKAKSCLIFTNTRSQTEIWYQKLLEANEDLAGLMAMHHGSLDRHVRDWVEEALYDGRLKAVVCTSSLDLGVDFRPVDTVIHIGSPKGIAKFMQRAGRSGHQPNSSSKIFFIPTHALEIAESSALQTAIESGKIEKRMPYIRSFDVLIQYLMTLAVSDGFNGREIYKEIKKTFSFNSVDIIEWQKVLNFLVIGSNALQAYDEFQKVEKVGEFYQVTNKRIAQRHKLSIGVIVSEGMIKIKYVRGKVIGTVEEWFVSQLSPGDVFWFAGRALELVRMKDMMAQVRDSSKKTSRIPSYLGGRLPLSTEMSEVLRANLYNYSEGNSSSMEMAVLAPIFDLQRQRSSLPVRDVLLIEYFESDEGFHLLIYPFEGRLVHEGIAALIAKRISYKQAISFSIAMNDYGFELLSDQKINVEKIINHELFEIKNLASDIQASINAVEMARRRFRDISRISGLIFQGFPGKQKKDRHLQASSQLIFDVFKAYDDENILYQQTYDEVMSFQLEEARLRKVLERIKGQKIVIQKPEKATPFAFPIIVDRLREKLTSERLEDRIRKMTMELEK